jgi:hypothetical protein
VLHFTEVRLGPGEGTRCELCHGPAETRAYTSASILTSLIAQAVLDAQATGPNVAFTGPEPFDHPELPSVVGMAASAGVARLRIDTDATALSNAANAAGSVAAGVRQLRVTLLGGSPGTHDALFGKPSAFEAALMGMRAFVRAGDEADVAISLTALVPVCRHNVRDLPAVVAVAGEAGADSVLLRIDDGGVDLGAALPWLTAACDTGVVNGVWVEVEGLPYCMAPDATLHLADTVRERDGSHGPRCGECPLAEVCAGGPVDASADTLASLVPPAGAAKLAARILLARGEGSWASR